MEKGKALVRITYNDPFMEFDEGDVDAPSPCQVVGWVLTQRWDGWVTIASESTGQGWRCVTHIPAELITNREVLWPSPAANRVGGTTQTTTV